MSNSYSFSGRMRNDRMPSRGVTIGLCASDMPRLEVDVDCGVQIRKMNIPPTITLTIIASHGVF